MTRKWLFPSLALLVLLGLIAYVAQPVRSVRAAPPPQDDPVTRGKYLATIAGCVDCHTPIDDKFQPLAGMDFAGGYPFDLGPLGIVYTKNLTPDPETGLGNWTDDEIKLAIRAGKSKDGLQLFPIMPYVIFNGMAEADLDALVAYLRTLKPVNNAVERRQVLPPEQLPQLPVRSGIVAPASSDTAARGTYLMTAVIPCTDCHTPVDQTTGQPIMDKYLAGGQPYEGPWGIVYGANLTPDPDTGLGKWSDEDIKRLLRQGVRPDGRRVVLMPWRLWTSLTDDDLNAIVFYLRNTGKAVKNEVPKAALNEGWTEIVPVEATTTPGPNYPLIIGGVIAALVVLGGGGYFLMRRQKKA